MEINRNLLKVLREANTALLSSVYGWEGAIKDKQMTFKEAGELAQKIETYKKSISALNDIENFPEKYGLVSQKIEETR